MKCRQLLANDLLWLARQGGAFEEHAVDALGEGARRPPLDPAHLGVKGSLQLVLEVAELPEVAP